MNLDNKKRRHVRDLSKIGRPIQQNLSLFCYLKKKTHYINDNQLNRSSCLALELVTKSQKKISRLYKVIFYLTRLRQNSLIFFSQGETYKNYLRTGNCIKPNIRANKNKIAPNSTQSVEKLTNLKKLFP